MTLPHRKRRRTTLPLPPRKSKMTLPSPPRKGKMTFRSRNGKIMLPLLPRKRKMTCRSIPMRTKETKCTVLHVNDRLSLVSGNVFQQVLSSFLSINNLRRLGICNHHMNANTTPMIMSNGFWKYHQISNWRYTPRWSLIRNLKIDDHLHMSLPLPPHLQKIEFTESQRYDPPIGFEDTNIHRAIIRRVRRAGLTGLTTLTFSPCFNQTLSNDVLPAGLTVCSYSIMLYSNLDVLCSYLVVLCSYLVVLCSYLVVL